MNDTILPCDYKSAGQIDDNELNQRLCAPFVPLHSSCLRLGPWKTACRHGEVCSGNHPTLVVGCH